MAERSDNLAEVQTWTEGWLSEVVPRGTYQRIARDLRDMIADGTFASGGLLPSESALALHYGVARGTVRSALSVLASEGLIEVLPGQGRRVVGEATDSQASPTTAWEKVASDLRQRLKEDLELPSEAQLSAEHQVSRNTVRRAYRQLVEEGLVIVRHGAGAIPVQSPNRAPNA